MSVGNPHVWIPRHEHAPLLVENTQSNITLVFFHFSLFIPCFVAWSKATFSSSSMQASLGLFKNSALEMQESAGLVCTVSPHFTEKKRLGYISDHLWISAEIRHFWWHRLKRSGSKSHFAVCLHKGPGKWSVRLVRQGFGSSVAGRPIGSMEQSTDSTKWTRPWDATLVQIFQVTLSVWLPFTMNSLVSWQAFGTSFFSPHFWLELFSPFSPSLAAFDTNFFQGIPCPPCPSSLN